MYTHLNIAVAGQLLLVDYLNCIVFIDDIVIYSKTLEQHKIDVFNVLRAIQKYNLNSTPPKCLNLRSSPSCLVSFEFPSHMMSKINQQDSAEFVSSSWMQWQIHMCTNYEFRPHVGWHSSYTRTSCNSKHCQGAQTSTKLDRCTSVMHHACVNVCGHRFAIMWARENIILVVLTLNAFCQQDQLVMTCF